MFHSYFERKNAKLARANLAGLLYPLTTNEFSLKNSFDAANRIKAMPTYLFRKWLPIRIF